jgi:hypothetical protein
MDPRFKGVQFPVWFEHKEKKLASKVLDHNQHLTAYQAMLATSRLCNDGTPADKYLNSDKVIHIDEVQTPRL